MSASAPRLTEQERSAMFAADWRDSGMEAAHAELRRAADYGDYDGMARANAKIRAIGLAREEGAQAELEAAQAGFATLQAQIAAGPASAKLFRVSA